MNTELNDRLFKFSIDILKFLPSLPLSPEFKVVRYQLAKSSTSSGANYEEAQGAISRPDFKNKVYLSLKEMRESHYWLRIIKQLECKKSDIDYLLKEASELKNILGSICIKLK